jgi:hypothetical protein
MTANYADTGILLKSYVLEAYSNYAECTLRKMGALCALFALNPP